MLITQNLSCFIYEPMVLGQGYSGGPWRLTQGVWFNLVPP